VTLAPDRIARVYDRMGRWLDTQAFYEDAAIADLIAHADFAAARSVFEFGCGTGRMAARLLGGHLPADARYHGVDVSARMVAIARGRLARWGDRATVEHSDGGMTIAEADGAIDRLVSTYVLDLLSADDIGALLVEAGRALAPDGLLCLASLTFGVGPFSRFVTGTWMRLHRWRPNLTGGCRPIRLTDHLDPGAWAIRHQAVIVRFGVPTQIVVAAAQPLP
jgi:ubiquinone/menaquinone biosynthesis C-methylase UbiE